MNNTYEVRKIKIYGIVQGVGFRPFVKRLADAFCVTGNVKNCGSFVEIIARAQTSTLESFVEAIKNEAPVRASIEKIESEDVSKKEIVIEGFQIISSTPSEGDILIPSDIAICDNCKRELFDPTNRRFGHPFINCTDCGPRLTILKSMPYDRVRTVMGEFEMCPECEAEYFNPNTRRFDAQPVCCNECGPKLYLIKTKTSDVFCEEKKIELVVNENNNSKLSNDRACIKATADVIKNGGIVAVKGIGGFHLVCDGTAEKSIELLRQRKGRPVKPFAVMCKDLETVEKYCEVSDAEREILEGDKKPIVLLKKKDSNLPENLAVGATTLGVMLPYTPLLLLLFKEENMPDILLMTSANTGGAPIVRDDKEAVEELSGLCDLILSNDRDILIRADDSVLEVFENKPYMVRRSRGYAPLPVTYKSLGKYKNILAVGGELKNSFCIAKKDKLYLSPYIGDLSDLGTLESLEETVVRFSELLEFEPEVVVCDMHPGYLSSKFAREYAKKNNLPLLEVQHHYAHGLSLMAENNLHEKIIVAAMDGTGYGLDENGQPMIWGSEIFVMDERGYELISHLSPFMQVGGDTASKEPWRSAVSILLETAVNKKENSFSVFKLEENRAEDKVLSVKNKILESGLCDEKAFDTILAMRENGLNVAKSSSLGRYFDAASALSGVCSINTFEGEAAMALQYEAERYLSGQGGKEEAYVFHKEMAKWISGEIIKARKASGIKKAGLTGGCFQNTLLLQLTIDELLLGGFDREDIFIHSLIPANDGGIALGQAVYAAAFD